MYIKLDTVHYTIYHEIFEIGTNIQEVWHSTLRDIFIYKKRGTSQKARQFPLGFFKYKKPDTLSYAIFHRIFEIGRGRGAF